MNATKTEARETFDGQIDETRQEFCDRVASEICDELREIERTKRADSSVEAVLFYRETTSEEEEAAAETYGQSPVEKARANYHRWRDIANDAMRQYRYAASALARELRAEEDHRKQQTADAERRQTRDRSDSAAGRSETA